MAVDLADKGAAPKEVSEEIFYQEEESSNNNKPRKSIFSDEKGNLKFVNLVVRYPTLVFFAMVFLCYFSAWLLNVLARNGGNPITEDTNAYDINDVRSIAYDSLRLAKEQIEEEYEEENESRRLRGLETSDARVQEDVGDFTYWIYEAKTKDGLFTQDSIPYMREVEATILENENYTEYCNLQYENDDGTTVENPECRKPLSIMNVYYASSWNSSLAQEILADLTQENINIFNKISPCVEYGVMCQNVENYPEEDVDWVTMTSIKVNSMMDTWDGKGDLNPSVEEVTNFIAHMNELFTKAPNVNFFFDAGFNVTNQKSMFSRSIFRWGQLLEGTEDEDESEDKLKKFILDNLLEKWTDLTSTKNNKEVQSYYFMGALIFDVILKILLTDGLKAIGSFVAVFFYLRIMLGSWFLTAVGMFEIFMSLPLSWLFFSYVFQIKYFSTLNTLCIFIVMAIGADDIFVFMDAYKQSAGQGPEVLESLESRMSWVYRRSGSAMLLTSITTCAAFICTTFASPIAGTASFGIFAAFVIFFDYLLVMTLFCTSVVIYHNRFESKPYCCNCSFWVQSNPSPTEIALKKREDGEELEVDKISLFFKEKMGPFIMNGKNRIGIGIVLTSWIILSACYAAQLKPTTTSEQFLDDDHPLQKGATILSTAFPKTQEDRTSQIHFIWGLEEISRDGVNQLLDPEFTGNAAFAESFKFDETCQSAILNASFTLESDPDLEEFILKRDGVRSVECFVKELGAYKLKGDDATCIDARRYTNWTDEPWQVSPDDLQLTMEAFVQNEACGEDPGSIRTYYDDSLGWNGTALKYVGVSVDSSLLDPNQLLGESVVKRHYDQFIKTAKKLDEFVAEACGSNVIMTDLDQKFVAMHNQRIYRVSAVTGSMVGIATAFVVLFVSTRKLHISLFATIAILCVLVGVIGCTTMLGWTLGTIEAILISILAGFSVDYVIHLAHAYVHAEGDTEERISSAFGEMGISVFSGMLTSVVASIPLFFCTLTFFAKFGTFLCVTIALSWIFANFGFMSLLATFKISMDRKWL